MIKAVSCGLEGWDFQSQPSDIKDILLGRDFHSQPSDISFMYPMRASVSSVVEFPGAGSSRLRTINSELNGAT